MVKTLAIRESVDVIIQRHIVKIIIESDSLTIIQVIKEEVLPPSQVRNLVKDINVLAKVVNNIEFMYCNWSAISWLAKKARLFFINLGL